MTTENPYRTLHARMSPPGAAWDEGFAAGRAAATPDTRSKIHGTGNVPAPDRWLALDRRSGRVAGLPTVEVVAAEDYDREVNDLRDQVQMYEEKAERDWRDFGEMQDARIAADDRVVELEKELARVCKQLDSANDMVERARSLAHRSLVAATPDPPPCRCPDDWRYDDGSVSCPRHPHNPDAPAASPDERLREALRTMIDVYDRHDRWCGHYAQAPGDGIIHRIDGARNALAAADREAHLEPAPQNDATRAQIVAAKLIADREAPDEAEGQKITHGRHCTCTPCAVEDWTNPAFAPCGMHGKDCPQEYQPLGPAGSFTPPADEPKETTT